MQYVIPRLRRGASSVTCPVDVNELVVITVTRKTVTQFKMKPAVVHAGEWGEESWFLDEDLFERCDVTAVRRDTEM